MELGTIYLEVEAKHLDALRTFYAEQLGLEFGHEEPGESIWFVAGGATLGFHAAASGESDPGLVNLSFNVADADAEAARLAGLGLTISQGPMDAPWNGSRVAVLFDPVGHTVWLSGPPAS